MLRFLALLTALAVVVAACRDGGGGGEGRRAADQRLEQAVTVDGVFKHLAALQRIADENGGTRASGSPGFDASVDYVVSQLRAAGYEPDVQAFDFVYSHEARPTRLERIAPSHATFAADDDFIVLGYSGSGDVSAAVHPVDPGTSSGCDPGDFDGFPAGDVALLVRGGCFFFQKVGNAEAAGAAAVLVMNDGSPGHERPLAATLVRPTAEIPALGISHALGEGLGRGGTTVHVAADIANEQRQTRNVCADLAGASDAPVVLVGAHLDSVANGPGINDNGSGSATVLEIARQARRIGLRPERGLRFCFWAAEELGLYGSGEYAKRLDGAGADEIAAVLNFDMLGSPNFARLVYDGDAEPRGSAAIESEFRAWFAAHGIPLAEIELAGRSDHAPFAQLGIPVGGLFSGADEAKTDEEEREFGGETGQPHDACYHSACDTLANVDRAALGPMADAAAVVALRLASA
jgi:Zn-dependent M28 family amino/carboxypeptidase